MNLFEEIEKHKPQDNQEQDKEFIEWRANRIKEYLKNEYNVEIMTSRNKKYIIVKEKRDD